VVARRDAGDAKEANFHGQCLGCRLPKVKRENAKGKTHGV